MFAREIMNTFFVTMRPSEPIQVAVNKMTTEQVGIVCVCNDDHIPVGVLTDRDIVTRGCYRRLSCLDTPVESIMTPNPLTCSPNSPLEEVRLEMSRRGMGRILVTDDARQLVGVITLAEIWHSESPFIASAVSRRVTERELRVAPTSGFIRHKSS